MSRFGAFNLVENEKTLWLDNGLVGLDFARLEEHGGAFWLRGVINVKSGAVFQIQENTQDPWWEMEWRDREGSRAVISSSSVAACNYRIDSCNFEEEIALYLDWNGIPLRVGTGYGNAGVAITQESPEDKVDVEVVVRLRRGDPLTYWSMSMKNHSPNYGLWRWTFPMASNIKRSGADRKDDHLTLPDGWGSYIPQPASQSRLTVWGSKEYPGGTWTMQFLAFDNAKEGLYLGIHDPKARPKHFDLKSNPEQGTLYLSINHFPENMTHVQPEAKVEHVVIGTFQGGWYEAASIYRSWALKQKWVGKGKIQQRKDIPQWFKDIVIWWCLSSATEPIERIGDLAAELQRRFPYPTGVHWYSWHQIPFDTSYPDYLPAKVGFKEQVKRLSNMGITVMPYINARLADSNSKTWQEDGMETYCAKYSSARCEPKNYQKYIEEYGNGQFLTPMCAYTSYWQNKVQQIVRALSEEIGVSAVYLDQIGATSPPICFDPNHGHSQGGGDYGIRGYEMLFEKIQSWLNESGRHMAFTTECNAEPFMSGVSAYLLWHSAHNRAVPIFPVVYGGHTLTFGRMFNDSDLKDPQAFIAKIGQMFVWGCQLGWISNSVARGLLTPEHRREADYLDNVCKAFELGRPYILEGRMLQPPKILSSVGKIITKWSVFWETVVELPEVLSTLWLAPDNSFAVAITNMSPRSQSLTCQVEDKELGIMLGGRYRVQDMSRETPPETITAPEDGKLIVTATLLPDSATILKITRE